VDLEYLCTEVTQLSVCSMHFCSISPLTRFQVYLLSCCFCILDRCEMRRLELTCAKDCHTFAQGAALDLQVNLPASSLQYAYRFNTHHASARKSLRACSQTARSLYARLASGSQGARSCMQVLAGACKWLAACKYLLDKEVLVL
jgi:hypothetical protein